MCFEPKHAVCFFRVKFRKEFIRKDQSFSEAIHHSRTYREPSKFANIQKANVFQRWRFDFVTHLRLLSLIGVTPEANLLPSFRNLLSIRRR